MRDPAVSILDAVVIQHLRGCPVPLNPDNEAMQARVEAESRQRDDLRMNYEGLSLNTPRMTVVHCCECGAMTYVEGV